MISKRSNEKELIDLGPDFYTEIEYKHCLEQLFKINKLIGFFRATVKFLNKLPSNLTVLDIGCGDGLFILHLNRFFPNMKFQGIDVNPKAIQLAKKNLKKQTIKNLNFKLSSQPELILPPNSIDIILSTLVCHHLTDEELIEFLKRSYHSVRKAVVINDLHRHFFSYFFYKLLSPFFRNRLITHDGLISIKKGFKRQEWIGLLNRAGINNYQIQWGFPFRWRVILWKK